MVVFTTKKLKSADAIAKKVEIKRKSYENSCKLKTIKDRKECKDDGVQRSY